jgi:hypothetical protein
MSQQQQDGNILSAQQPYLTGALIANPGERCSKSVDISVGATQLPSHRPTGMRQSAGWGSGIQSSGEAQFKLRQ